MEIQGSLGQIKDLIGEAKKVIVFGHKNPNLDGVASLLAFGQILEKLQKDYLLVCQDGIPQELAFLKGSDSIKMAAGSRNLVIGIKNGKELVEKVSYFTQEEDFNLVISPRGRSITADQIVYSFTGLEADLLIVLDTIRPNGIGSIYETFSQDFKDLPLINIDRHSQNTRYGKVNLVDSSFSSTSELVFQVSEELNISFDKDLATIFLAGVYGGSHNFLSQTTSAKSFELSARLLEKGADLGMILENLGSGYRADKNQINSEPSELDQQIAHEPSMDFEGSEPEKEAVVAPVITTPAAESVNQAEVNKNVPVDEMVDVEEYHLPTPSLDSLGGTGGENPFADPKIS